MSCGNYFKIFENFVQSLVIILKMISLVGISLAIPEMENCFYFKPIYNLNLLPI